MSSQAWDHLKSHIYSIWGSFTHPTSIVHSPFVWKFATDMQLTGLKDLVIYGPCLQGLLGKLDNYYLICPDMKSPVFFPHDAVFVSKLQRVTTQNLLTSHNCSEAGI